NLLYVGRASRQDALPTETQQRSTRLMKPWTWINRGAAVASAGLVALALVAASPAAEAANPPAVRIGLVKSLFRDVPEWAIPIGLRPMKELMESQTGVSG